MVKRIGSINSDCIFFGGVGRGLGMTFCSLVGNE